MSHVPALFAAFVDGLGVQFLVAEADFGGGVHRGVNVQVVLVVVLVDTGALFIALCHSKSGQSNAITVQ